jgi:putative acetyltransferase
MPEGFLIRPVCSSDDAAVAAIIRAVMPEFGADGPGFAIHDPEVDHMNETYTQDGSAYFVLESCGRVLGGAGIAPLEGGPEGVCELKKMYFLPEARGHGAGERMIRLCLRTASEFGYRTCYLETLSGMERAMHLYAKVGFAPLCAPLGATGHHGCDHWFALELA